MKDVTAERRSFEEQEALGKQIQENRRYDSLGIMASGLAHDFNNLLTIILGHASIAKSKLGPGSAYVDHFDEIEVACQRAGALCNQLSAYAGVGRSSLGAIDLVELVRGSESLLRAEADGTPLKFTYPDGPVAVHGEASQIRQAIRNAVQNAAEAVGRDGGPIEIDVAAPVVLSPGERDGFQLAPQVGTYAIVAIRDRGAGMTGEVLERIVDPFFSTKFVGRGLGLAAVYGIQRRHRGGLRIASAVGRGTSVELAYAAVKPKAIPVAVVAESPGTVRATTTATILLVDDDPNIRELLAMLLNERGFRVTTAKNGPDAIERFAAPEPKFEMAIVDFLMPGMNGYDVVQKFRQRRPKFPAVVVSGFTDREVPAAVLDGGPTEILAKPFRIEHLLSAVQRVLDAGR